MMNMKGHRKRSLLMTIRTRLISRIKILPITFTEDKIRKNYKNKRNLKYLTKLKLTAHLPIS